MKIHINHRERIPKGGNGLAKQIDGGFEWLRCTEDYANIYISSDIDESQATNYVRDLDMRTALATVNYDYEGVHYTREYFNSYPDNVLVVRLTADEKGKIDFTTNIESCMTGISPSIQQMVIRSQ
ncbi:MAG: glycoside hydrolase N-terminal domain-containing protein [Mediterraneibacter gnavus]